MLLSDISICRPVFAWMIMFGVMFFGILSFRHLGFSQGPETTSSVLTISVGWNGAAPELMETEIVDPIEEAAMSLEGITDVEANMGQGFAYVKLTFSNYKNMDAALQETNSRLRTIKFPSDVQPPIILRYNSDDEPIMWLSITSSQRSLYDLIVYFDLKLRSRFQVIPEVSNIILGGWRERSLRIGVDNNKLIKNQLTVLDIQNTLFKENNEVPSGYLENDKSRLNVRTMGEVITPEQMGDIQIATRGGQRVYQSNIHIRDVATVMDSLEDQRGFVQANGTTCISIGIHKQHGANDVAVSKAVRAFMDGMNEELATTAPDLHVNVTYDSTKYISDAMNETEFTLALCILLTGFVCCIFLGSWSSSFNVLLSIPTSILGTFIFMDLCGFTLNYATLLGLSLAVGVVADDSIMVLENIVRHFHMGKTARRAAMDGAREITFAAVAATAAVVSIFGPLIDFKAIPIAGLFLLQFGLTFSVAVLISLLEALTVTPMRCSQFMKRQQGEFWIARKMNALFHHSSQSYLRILDTCLNHRWLVLIGSLSLFILSLSSIRFIQTEFLPKQDIGLLLIRFETPIGSSIEYTIAQAKKFERVLKDDPRVDHFVVYDGGDPNHGISFITLKTLSERLALHRAALSSGHKLDYTQQDVISDLRGKLLALFPNKELIPYFIDLSGSSGGAKRGNSVELSVRGPDYAVLKEKVDEMIKRFKASGLLIDIDTDYREGGTEIDITPDREKAAACGVSMQTIASTINAAIGGIRQGKFTNNNQRYDVFVRLLPEQRSSVDDVQKLLVRTYSGELIPLAAVSHIVKERKLLSITQEMREHAINIYANTVEGKSLTDAMSFVQKTSREVLPYNYHMEEVGQSKDFNEGTSYTLFIFVMSLICLYMILAVLFNSFTLPISIMVILFFALTGALISLLLTHNSINLYSVVGIIALTGIATKNSILLVEFCNKQRQEHQLPLRKAILVGAPIRLRPIIMTSVATIFSMIPIACGIGPGAEVRSPMAIVVIGGIAVSTLFSLILVPCLYSLLAACESDQYRAQRELDSISGKYGQGLSQHPVSGASSPDLVGFTGIDG